MPSQVSRRAIEPRRMSEFSEAPGGARFVKPDDRRFFRSPRSEEWCEGTISKGGTWRARPYISEP